MAWAKPAPAIGLLATAVFLLALGACLLPAAEGPLSLYRQGQHRQQQLLQRQQQLQAQQHQLQMQQQVLQQQQQLLQKLLQHHGGGRQQDPQVQLPQQRQQPQQQQQQQQQQPQQPQQPQQQDQLQQQQDQLQQQQDQLQQQQQQQQQRQQRTYTVSVLRLNVSETPMQRYQRYTKRDNAAFTQYATGAVFEEHVRGVPQFVEDPQQADVVLVPFYPGVQGLYKLFPGSLTDVSFELASQLVPQIEALPDTTVVVCVIAHVDAWKPLYSHILSRIRLKQSNRRIVVLRTDGGDTPCRCMYRPFWDASIESIHAPYAVSEPPEFISVKERSKDVPVKNVTLFGWMGQVFIEERARLLNNLTTLAALGWPGLDVRLFERQKFVVSHKEYLDRMLRSKFCLVTEGDVTTSLRLFEAIVARCVPVITSNCLVQYEAPFGGTPQIGNYSDFAVILPFNATALDVVRRIDALLATGGYERLLRRLDAVWPWFTMHASLPQPGAPQLMLQQVYAAAERMDKGLPPLAAAQMAARTKCGS